MITIIALMIYSVFVTIAFYMIDSNKGDNLIGNAFLYIVGGPIMWIISLTILIGNAIKTRG